MASSEPLIATVTDKASVLDIVSYGYRTAVRHIWPLTILSIPTVILGCMQGFHNHSEYQEGLAIGHAIRNGASPLLLLETFQTTGTKCWILSLYFYYCASLYIRDVYFNQVDRPLHSYFFGEKKTLKVILIFSLVSLLSIIPIGIVGIIGLILLILPGITWFLYVLTVYNMSSLLILQKPEMGAKWSILESFRLLKSNIIRAIGLSLLTWLVNTIIISPLSFFTSSILMVAKISSELLLSLLNMLSYGLHAWLFMVVAYAGTVFITYRFIADLKIRHGDAHADSMLPAPIEQKA